MRSVFTIAASAIVLFALAGCSHQRAPTTPTGASANSPPTTASAPTALSSVPPGPTTGAPAIVDGIEIGQRAPDFALTSFDGRRVLLSEFRGRPVVIDFWAGWCPFCVTEFPALERAYQASRADGLIVLGVHRNDGEDQTTGERFAAERGVTFPLLQDEGDRVYRTFAGGTPAMPLSYFIDREGIIRAKIFGPKTDDRIAEYLSRIR